jgi:hypothetical protein
MNFSLATDSPFNTVLVSPEGRAAYRIETPSFLSSLTTTVTKVAGDGRGEMELGRVVWQSGRPGTVVVHGRELSIAKNKFFGS